MHSGVTSTVYDATWFHDELKELVTALGIGQDSSSSKDRSAQVSKGMKQGYLWRRAKGPLKAWVRKYYWIQMPEGLLMYYPKTKSTDDASAVADLSYSTFSEIEFEDRSLMFEVSSNAVGQLALQAENEQDLREWIAALSAARTIVTESNVDMSRWKPPVKILTAEDLGSPIPSPRNSKVDTGASLMTPLSRSKSNLSISSSRDALNSDSQNGCKPDEVMMSGFLAIKELRAGRRISGAQKDYANVLWRTTRLVLYGDGRLMQQSSDEVQISSTGNVLNAGSRERILEILNVKAQVTNRHYIEFCDESLFNRKNVFLISNRDQRMMYYAASNGLERNAWVYALKRVALGDVYGADGLSFRAYRTLALRVIEGRGFSANDSYCELYFGTERKARTNTRNRSNGEPFWREEYTYKDIPSLRYGITIYVMSQNKLSKDNELGRVTLAPGAIKPGDVEAWYPISISTDSNRSHGTLPDNTYGDLKLRIKFDEDIVLTQDQYVELVELFDHHDTEFVFDLVKVSTDLEYISQLLLNIYDSKGQAVQWLQFLIDQEVGATENTFVLFRANSILTKSLDWYMKVCGADYLEMTLGDIMKDICDNKVFVEVDPTRLEKNDDLRTHWKKLMSYANNIWDSIEKSKTQVPRELRTVFYYLQKSVMARFGTQDEDKFMAARYTSVSGFLFLRFFCPAILNPKLFSLCKDYPEGKVVRTLTLLAKTMQCLANLANFGVKEPYMVEMNAFIMEHSHSVMEFIDNISTRPSNQTPLSAHAIDQEVLYSSLHRFIRNNTLELQKLAERYSSSKDIYRSTTDTVVSGTAKILISPNKRTLVPTSDQLSHVELKSTKSTVRAETIMRALNACDLIEGRIGRKLQ